jgi:hypothetical protein
VEGFYDESVFKGDHPLVSSLLPDFKLTANQIFLTKQSN